MSIILASASPRRAELLRQLQLEFQVAPMDINEAIHKNETAIEYVQRIAREKALAAAQQYSAQDVIVAADTTVCLDDKVYGKPKDRADGLQMLAALSGRSHIVRSAVVVSYGNELREALSETEVIFRDISAAEAEQYWRSGEPQDKAGGYAIQGLGATFIEAIRGSYTGVVGLPLFELTQLLRETGVSIL